jgi:HTH-type transcriptional regulator / antitoxin HigA
MKPKIIKTRADYKAALNRIEELFEAVPGMPAGDELELLVTLVELYETKEFPIDLPDPLTAIRFRMEQQGLRPKDLVPFIGSPSKVSEVLSGQRSLSLSMIRNLVTGLDIPAEVLLREPGAKLDVKSPALQWHRFPVTEMLKRGWFGGFHGTSTEAHEQREDLLTAFAASMGIAALQPSFNRQHIRSGSKMDEFALAAWRIRVGTIAARESLPPYRRGTLDTDFLRELVRLSYLDAGPTLAKEFLNKSGIHFVVERHLPKTFLDGAALKLPDGSPVVALTLRLDRLDNFWFTLCHELAHIALHIDKDDIDIFYDNLENSGTDKYETEADKFASEALIPQQKWNKAGLSRRYSAQAIRVFAEDLRINPAIPAGRIRFEKKNYIVLKDLVGAGKVRRLFAA